MTKLATMGFLFALNLLLCLERSDGQQILPEDGFPMMMKWYDNGAVRYLDQVYKATLGNLENFVEIKNFKVRETDICWLASTDYVYYTYRPTLPNCSYVGTGYYGYGPKPEEGLTGPVSMEEATKYYVNILETRLIEQISSNPHWVSTRIKYLEESSKRPPYLHLEIDTQMKRMISESENIFGHSLKRWLTYDGEFLSDKLFNHLHNYVFYENPDNRELLSGHYDVLSTLLMRPKYIQSPKVKPLLRMALAKYISETEDFDIKALDFIETLFIRLKHCVLFQVYGITEDNVKLFTQKLKQVYEDNFVEKDEFTGEIIFLREVTPWIDLADAVLREVELIDIDDLFYRLYSIILKTRNLLSGLDLTKVASEIDYLWTAFQKSYHHVLAGKWPSLENATFEVLETLQTDQFWSTLDDSYHSLILTRSLELSKGFPLSRSWCSSWSSALRLQNLDNFFKLKAGRFGEQTFPLTIFLNNYREKTCQSLFQPSLKLGDPRAALWDLYNILKTPLPTIYHHFVTDLSGQFGEIYLTPLDWSVLEDVKKNFVKVGKHILSQI